MISKPVRPARQLGYSAEFSSDSTLSPIWDLWMRRASAATVVLGILFYIYGIISVLDGREYYPAFLDHLIIRGIAAAVAALILLIGIWINKPRHLAPWIFFFLLIFSYTLRPLLANMGVLRAWDGWLIFAIILFQRSADAAAIIAIVWLRKTGRITSTRIENAILVLAYSVLVVHEVVIPGWKAFDSLPSP